MTGADVVQILNWISDHWVLVLALSCIASASYSVPKIIATLVIGNGVR